MSPSAGGSCPAAALRLPPHRSPNGPAAPGHAPEPPANPPPAPGRGAGSVPLFALLASGCGGAGDPVPGCRGGFPPAPSPHPRPGTGRPSGRPAQPPPGFLRSPLFGGTPPPPGQDPTGPRGSRAEGANRGRTSARLRPPATAGGAGTKLDVGWEHGAPRPAQRSAMKKQRGPHPPTLPPQPLGQKGGNPQERRFLG